jgi:hypothetical protein
LNSVIKHILSPWAICFACTLFVPFLATADGHLNPPHKAVSNNTGKQFVAPQSKARIDAFLSTLEQKRLAGTLKRGPVSEQLRAKATAGNKARQSALIDGVETQSLANCDIVDGHNGAGGYMGDDCWLDPFHQIGAYGPIVLDEMAAIKPDIQQLERVVVTGTSFTEMAGLCINGICGGYVNVTAVAEELAALGQFHLVASLADIFLPTPKVVACATLLAPPSARATTSLFSDDERRIAAGQLMMAARGFANTIFAAGRDYEITWADGGTETYEWNTGNPAAPLRVPDLVKGDGVNRCTPVE